MSPVEGRPGAGSAGAPSRRRTKPTELVGSAAGPLRRLDVRRAVHCMLVVRDGPACYFCGRPGDERTLKVARARGEPDTGAPADLLLECRACGIERDGREALEHALRSLAARTGRPFVGSRRPKDM